MYTYIYIYTFIYSLCILCLTTSDQCWSRFSPPLLTIPAKRSRKTGIISQELFWNHQTVFMIWRSTKPQKKAQTVEPSVLLLMRSLTSKRIRERMLADHDIAATANLKQSWPRLAPTLLWEWAPNTACLLEVFAELALVTLLLIFESDDSEDSDDSSWWLQEKSCLWAFGFENSGKRWSWSTSASSSSSSVTWKQQPGQSHHIP